MYVGWGFFLLWMLFCFVMLLKMFVQAIIPVLLIVIAGIVIYVIVKCVNGLGEYTNDYLDNSEKNIDDDYWCK